MAREYDLCYSFEEYEPLTPNDRDDLYDEQDETRKLIIDNFGWESDISPRVAVFAVHMANYKATNNLWYDLIRLYQDEPANDYYKCPSELEPEIDDAEFQAFEMMMYQREMGVYPGEMANQDE